MVIRKQFVHLYSQKDYVAIVKDTEKYHLIAPKKVIDDVVGKMPDRGCQEESLVTPYTHVLVAHKTKLTSQTYLHANSVWTMVLLPDTRVEVYKNGKVILFGNAVAELYNMSSAICFDESAVTAYDFSRCFALDDSRVQYENYSTTYLFDNAKVVEKKELENLSDDNKHNPNVNPTIFCCGKKSPPQKPGRQCVMCYDSYLIQEMKLIFESNRKLKNYISPDISDRLK